MKSRSRGFAAVDALLIAMMIVPILCAIVLKILTTPPSEGITITGAKYPLKDGEITCEYQYGISNEVLPGETARVTVACGKLLLIKVR